MIGVEHGPFPALNLDGPIHPRHKMFRTYETLLQKNFWPKLFFVMFSALQNVAFSISERRMLLTVKRSRDRSQWRKKLCCDSAMIGKMADGKKKTVFVETFRARNL